MPIDLVCYAKDSYAVRMRRRFDERDSYFTALGRQWGEGTREVFRRLPDLAWPAMPAGHPAAVAVSGEDN